jgi:hypothetical protein
MDPGVLSTPLDPATARYRPSIRHGGGILKKADGSNSDGNPYISRTLKSRQNCSWAEIRVLLRKSKYHLHSNSPRSQS